MESLNLTCEYCKTPVKEPTPKCPSCGFPIGGTDVQKEIFYHQVEAQKGSLKDLQSKIYYARVMLWLVAGFTFLFGFINFFWYPEMEGRVVLLILNTVITGIFLLLASYAAEKPFTALILAACIYSAFFIFSLVDETLTFGYGVIGKLVAIGFLIKGALSAREAESMKKELDNKTSLKK
jgi:hypothetical protein